MVRDKKFYSSFFALMIPIMLQNVIVYSVDLMDNVMIGGWSELSISAVAVAAQIQFVLQMLTMGICEGIVVLCAQYWGQNRTDEIRRIVGIGMKLQVLLAAIFFSIIYFFPEFVAGIITPEPAVIEEAAAYLRIIAFSYLFFCLTNMLVSSMRVVESVRIGVIINLAALVSNIFLNYTLIYGHFGAPALGIRGAAIATTASRIIEFAIAVFYVYRVDRKLQQTIRGHFRWDFAFWRDYLDAGLPVLIANFIWALANVAQGAIVGRLSAQAIAANGIANTLFRLIYVAAGAVSGASGLMMGKLVGEGNLPKIKSYTRTLQVIYLVTGLLSSFVLFLSRDIYLSLFEVAPDTRAMANSFLLILCVTIIGSSYQAPCLTGIVRGGGDTRFVMINDFIFQWLIVIPFSALAAFYWNLPPVAVFFFLKSDQILKCFVAVVKVNRYRWVRVLTREMGI